MSDVKTRYHIDNNYLTAPLAFGEIRLVQIGRRYCEASEIIPAHLHLNWFELTAVTRGEAAVVTGGEETRVCQGEMYLSLPCDIHEIRAVGHERLEYDFFSFYCVDGELSRELDLITRSVRAGGERVFRDEKITSIVKNAISEISLKSQPYSEKLLSSLFFALTVYLIRDLTEAPHASPDVSDAEILCFGLMNYIDTHIYSIRSLTDVAESFNYNYSYLSKLFARTTGRTLSEYYRQRKMETAKALVIEGKKKIGEIADMLGYDLYSFSKAFKARYGVSPKRMQLGDKALS